MKSIKKIQKTTNLLQRICDAIILCGVCMAIIVFLALILRFFEVSTNQIYFVCSVYFTILLFIVNEFRNAKIMKDE